MPNWCSNEVMVRADTKEQMDELIAFVKSKEDDEEFSFQSIVPQPKELQETTSPTRIVSAKAYKERDKKTDNFMKPITKTMQKHFIEKYGVDNWYDWTSEYWGTKWDTCEVEVAYQDDTEIQYCFDTAWCPPYGIYHALVKRFPDLHISWFYREEGMEFAGYLPN